MKSITVFLALLFALLSADISVHAQFAEAPSHVKVELLADRTALVPGKSVDLAVRFTIDSGWHIYWRNRGEGGSETSFDWKLPEGFRIGPMLYPAPQRHVDEADAHTFILEGKPIFLTTLTVPPDAPVGQDVSITVKTEWLVCDEKVCHLGDKDLVLKLPVVADTAQTEPANESRFKAARADLPQPVGQAKYLDKLSAVASVKKVEPGEPFKVAVVATVQDGFHINSHKPLSEFLIATDLFHDAAEGLSIGRPVFPPGKVEESPVPDEKLSVYRGRTIIVLPVESDNSITSEEVRLSGIITYQACSDKTQQCFPPTSAEWTLNLPVASEGEQVAAANAEIFAAAAGAETKPATTQPVIMSQGDLPSDISSGSNFTWLGRVQMALAKLGLLGYLLMAFVGGFILNLMPCVLPVISIKVLSFVQQAKESRWRVFTLGLAFSSGILMSFVALGILMMFLGQQWGGLFQYPQVVIALAAVVTALALSLFGVFTLTPPRLLASAGAKVQEEGHLNALGMGLLATALGTACTAPFLGFAIAIASQKPPIIGMTIFIAAGLGMAIPYVLLALKPGWLKVIPKPGRWMVTFEHFMGFLLLGTVIWLLNTLNAQLGGEGVLWTLLFLLFVAMGMWFYGRVDFSTPDQQRPVFYAASFSLIAGGWWFTFHQLTTISDLMEAQVQHHAMRGSALLQDDLDWSSKKFPWIPYTRDRALHAVNSGRTVFVDYTAEWCANCKANEKIVIDTEDVRQAMKRLGVVPFQADYTSRDPEIKADLDKYGRAGVPMYLIIPAGRPDEAILLDELLTQSSLISGLEKAGPSVRTQSMTMR